MSEEHHGNRKVRIRKWQQRLIKWMLLLSLAGAVSIIWTLFEPKAAPIWSDTAVSAPSDTSAGTGDSTTSLPGQTQPVADPSGASQTKASKSAVSEDDIPVYLVGAVHKPGVYIVHRGIYLYELVDLAGGLTPDAAANSINLAMRITENQMVRIPTQAESESAADPGVQVSDSPASGKININTATQAMLEELPGVGPATAVAIIADRSKNGPFRQPEDLMRVPGIKESRYALMEALIAVG